MRLYTDALFEKGSKNKMTIARQAVAEILDVDTTQSLESAVHQRGHQMLVEMERIVMDPMQPVGARIMAAKTVLPFMLPSREILPESADAPPELIALLQSRREQLAQLRGK